jgi:MFS family permease
LFDSTGMTDSLRRSLYLVILAATFGNASGVITTGAAWTGFLREVVRADDLQLGIISAIPVIANTSQLFMSFLMERRNNRRFMFLFFGILGRSLWIPIGLLPFFIPEAVNYLRPWAVIVLVALIAGGNSAVNLCFSSLMGDLVPLRIRGRYFSVRYRTFVMAGILAGLAVSWIMDSTGVLGYTIVLVAAGILGVTDLSTFFFVEWPAMRMPSPEEKKQGFFSMIRVVLKDKPFMMVTLFYTAWFFSVNVAAPFFNVHMLETLHMNYTQITLYNQITSNVMAVLFVSRWGRLMDRFGNKPILHISVFICMLTPLMWLTVTPAMTWLVILLNLVSGTFWPPIDLGMQNFPLNLAGEKNHSMYLAVFFTVINLAGIALGNTVGGMMVQGVYTQLETLHFHLLGLTLNRYHYIFVTSSVLRILAVFLVLPLVKEAGSLATRPVVHEITQNSFTGVKRGLLRFQTYVRNKK